MPIRIGRWELDLFQRALHVTREPDPHCPDCCGEKGGWIAYGGDVDWGTCQCLDQLRTWRLPLWARRPYPAEEPF